MSEKLERAGRFFDNLEKLGYDENRAIQLLSTIDALEEEITRLRGQRDDLINDCTRERQRLSQLRTETSQATSELARINQEINEAKRQWSALLEKMKQESDRIEFVDAICQLFGDMSHVSLGLLTELALKLQMIVETRLKVEAYPIDYTQARETALVLLERALGKSLVRREVFDNVVKQHDDLMIDKLGKLELERDKIAKEKDELVGLKEAVGQMTQERALRAAVALQAKGLIGQYTCQTCTRTTVFTIVGQPDHLTSCPFCGGTNLGSRESPAS